MSAIKTAFQEIQDLLLNLGTPTLLFGTVESYRGQPENEETETTYARPAAFIEFVGIDWQTRGKGIQDGAATINIHYEFAGLDVDSLDFLDIMNEAQIALQNFDSDIVNPLRRIQTQQDPARTNRVVWVETYETTIHDAEANEDAKKTTKAPPTTITVNIR